MSEAANHGALEQSVPAGNEGGTTAEVGDILPPADAIMPSSSAELNVVPAIVLNDGKPEGDASSEGDSECVAASSVLQPCESSVSASISSSQHEIVPSSSVSVSDIISTFAIASHTTFSLHSEEQSADHVGSPDRQVLDAQTHEDAQPISAASTLLNIEAESASRTDAVDDTNNGISEPNEKTAQFPQVGENGDVTQLEHLPEPPASPASNTLLSISSTSTFEDSLSQLPAKVEVKQMITPSANRLSISYAGGNRRLVVDAEVVESLKVFRQEGRIEVNIEINKNDNNSLKGILVSFILATASPLANSTQ